ncbi:hypothetical protein C8T65DRAFT_655275 [Cerioporus squamosus]|nr:hypothetical protein C8T65DRAFT_655275 [Cerioporus squamosus]
MRPPPIPGRDNFSMYAHLPQSMGPPPHPAQHQQAVHSPEASHQPPSQLAPDHLKRKHSPPQGPRPVERENSPVERPTNRARVNSPPRALGTCAGVSSNTSVDPAGSALNATGGNTTGGHDAYLALLAEAIKLNPNVLDSLLSKVTPPAPPSSNAGLSARPPQASAAKPPEVAAQTPVVSAPPTVPAPSPPSPPPPRMFTPPTLDQPLYAPQPLSALSSGLPSTEALHMISPSASPALPQLDVNTPLYASLSTPPSGSGSGAFAPSSTSTPLDFPSLSANNTSEITLVETPSPDLGSSSKGVATATAAPKPCSATGGDLFRLTSDSAVKISALTGTCYGTPQQLSSAPARDIFFNGLNTGAKLIEVRLSRADAVMRFLEMHFNVLKNNDRALLSEADIQQYLEEIHQALRPGLEQMEGMFNGRMSADEVRERVARSQAPWQAGTSTYNSAAASVSIPSNVTNPLAGPSTTVLPAATPALPQPLPKKRGRPPKADSEKAPKASAGAKKKVDNKGKGTEQA